MNSILDHLFRSLYPAENYNKEYSKIYKVHKYWARKPWYIVERYIRKYSEPGDTVKDPFCGSGCVGAEAVLNGRNFIGQDLNPAALHVSRGTLSNNVDIKELDADFQRVKAVCYEKIMRLYESDRVCPSCGNKLCFKYTAIGVKFKGQYKGKLYCPSCGAKGEEVALSDEQVRAATQIPEIEIDKWVPSAVFPKKFYKDRFSYKGVVLVTDLFTRRNLYALSVLRDAIVTNPLKYRDLLMLAFTNTLLHASELKGENVRPLSVNNYWIPDDYIEENVWFRFEDRFCNIREGKAVLAARERENAAEGIRYGTWEVRLQSALGDMGEECVDYFFTDPPYGDAIQYSELSYVWNAWLGETYDIREEIIVNPAQNKGESEFRELLGRSLENIYRALKTGKYFTLCFQNKNAQVWKDVVQCCKGLGFQLVDVSIYDTYGSPYNKNWAKFSPKTDIYVTFRKAETPPESFYEKEQTVEDIIREIVAYCKERNLVLNNNKLYDLTIAYLIWAMFSNRAEINVKGFHIKSFSKKASKIINETSE